MNLVDIIHAAKRLGASFQHFLAAAVRPFHPLVIRYKERPRAPVMTLLRSIHDRYTEARRAKIRNSFRAMQTGSHQSLTSVRRGASQRAQPSTFSLYRHSRLRQNVVVKSSSQLDTRAHLLRSRWESLSGPPPPPIIHRPQHQSDLPERDPPTKRTTLPSTARVYMSFPIVEAVLSFEVSNGV